MLRLKDKKFNSFKEKKRYNRVKFENQSFIIFREAVSGR